MERNKQNELDDQRETEKMSRKKTQYERDREKQF